MVCGKACVQALAKQGFKIIALARHAERSAELETELKGQIHSICAVLSLPEHININELELMPVTQTWAGFHIEKL